MRCTQSLKDPLYYHTDVAEDRTASEKFTAFIKAFFNELKYFFKSIERVLHEWIYGTPAEYIAAETRDFQWTEENKGLYVLIHGLKGRPNIWQTQLSSLRNRGYEIRAPLVHEKGNCSIEEAVAPIFSLQWSKIMPLNTLRNLFASWEYRTAEELRLKSSTSCGKSIQIRSRSPLLLEQSWEQKR